jgi:eukaryotic-like serine/threonine-protein kinase
LSSLRRLVSGLASEGPHVIVLEDVHWADPSSVGVLSQLVPLAAELPVLLCVTARPDREAAGWRLVAAARESVAVRATELTLAPLSEAHSRRLVSNLLSLRTLSEAVERVVLRKAEGNPFFVEEIVRALTHGGQAGADGEEGSGVEEAAAGIIPDTLQGLLTARMDRLDDDVRHTLRVASVAGRRFTVPVLEAAWTADGGQPRGTAPEAVRAHLATLESAGLVEVAGINPELTYRFRHALIQEAAYSTLLRKDRQRLHRIIGETVEGLHPERRNELAGLLAHHFAEAEDDRAVFYLLEAADRALAGYANDEALGHLRRCLELVALQPDADERADLEARVRERMGDVLRRTGSYDDARDAYEQALRLRPVSDVLSRARLLLGTSLAWRTQRRLPEAHAPLEEAERSLEEGEVEQSAAWRRLWIEVQLERLMLSYFVADMDEFHRVADRARPVVEEHGTMPQRSQFFLRLAVGGLRVDRYTGSDESLRHAQEAHDLALASGDSIAVASGRFVLGFCLLWRGELDPAEEHLEGGLALATEIGEAVIRLQCLAYLAVAARRRGRDEDVRRYAASLFRDAQAQQSFDYTGAAHAHGAWLAWRERRLEDAQRDAEAALEDFHKVYPGYMMAWEALWPLLAVEIATDDLESAVDRARALIEINEGLALPDQLVDLLRVAVRAWEEGEADTARRHLADTVDLAESTGHF